jgi:hypothetical protein
MVGEGAHGVGHVHSGDGGGGGVAGGRRAARQGGATRGPRGVPVQVHKTYFISDPYPILKSIRILVSCFLHPMTRRMCLDLDVIPPLAGFRL